MHLNTQKALGGFVYENEQTQEKIYYSAVYWAYWYFPCYLDYLEQ